MHTNLARLRNLVSKAMQYLLHLSQHPVQAPKLLYYASRGVHLGEVLRLNKPWLRKYNVRTVIDVGANTGQFSSAISCVFPGAHIYAFEPLEHCYHTLVKRMSGKKNVEARCLALGDRTGRVSFYCNEFTKSSSLLEMKQAHKEAFPWAVQADKLTVDIDNLDNARSRMKIERPVLLKLDVQGSELFVLRGATEILPEIDIIIIEMSFQQLYDNQPLFDEIYTFLKQRGLSYHGNIGSLESPKDGSVLQEDGLFLRDQ